MTCPTVLRASMLQPGDVVKYHDPTSVIDDAYWLVLCDRAAYGRLLECIYHPLPIHIGRRWWCLQTNEFELYLRPSHD